MATQTVVAESVPGQTVTMKLFAGAGTSDTVVATSNTCTEQTNSKGQYVAAFVGTLIAAGTYHFRCFNASNVLLSDGYVDLAGTNNEVANGYDLPISLIGGGGGGDALEETSQEILAEVQALGATALSAAVWTAGVITGFPSSLVVGDSYIDDVNRHIKIYYRDSGGTPITNIGSKSVTDVDFLAKLVVSQDNLSSRVTGTCVWIPAVGPTEGYLKVELPRDQTRRAGEGIGVMQLTFTWGDSVEVEVSKQPVTWSRKIT
jgi:hypothetical protein